MRATATARCGPGCANLPARRFPDRSRPHGGRCPGRVRPAPPGWRSRTQNGRSGNGAWTDALGIRISAGLSSARTPLMRPSGRAPDALRQVTLETGVNRYAEGSCLVSFGHTKVLVTASLEESVPPFLRGRGRGRVTAEYG